MTWLDENRESLIYDISNLAFTVADLREGERSPHALHQVFDVCQPGNIDRVDRVMRLAYSEILHALGGYRPRDSQELLRLHELMREYVTTRVLADWLSITLPEAADAWKDRSAETIQQIGCIPSAAYCGPREIPPI